MGRIRLFATKPQPDQVERTAHAEQEPYEREVRGVEIAIREVASAAPEEQAREHVADDGPEGICLTIYSHSQTSKDGELVAGWQL